MRKPNKPKKPTDPNAPYREEPEPQRNPDADPVKLHRGYIERQLEGGAPATPEAYRRAVDQWRQLPGAVRVPASQLGELPGKPTAADSATSMPPATEEPNEEHS